MPSKVTIEFAGGYRKSVEILTPHETNFLSCYETAIRLSELSNIEHEMEMHQPQPNVSNEVLAYVGRLRAKLIVECSCTCQSPAKIPPIPEEFRGARP